MPLKIAKMDSPDHQILIPRVVAKAYQRLNIPVEFIELPGKRALEESSTGVIDGELARVFEIGIAYPTLIRIPTPIYWFEPTVFSKKIRFKVKGWNSLKSYEIGTMRGMRFAEIGLSGFKNVQIVENYTSLFQMLNADRVDIVVAADLNGLYELKKLGFDTISPLSPPLERILAYHYLHEKHRNIVQKLDQVFQEMQEKGEIEQIRKDFLSEIIENKIELNTHKHWDP
ncbi:MAG: transporter substrate-binding domain-containing protein [Desulfobacterales bacterium]|nr:transporter substrate-binding domain-containing protein [Desulfobacterales bacterium]